MVNNKKKSIDKKVNNSINMPEPHGEQAYKTWKNHMKIKLCAPDCNFTIRPMHKSKKELYNNKSKSLKLLTSINVIYKYLKLHLIFLNISYSAIAVLTDSEKR